jgi:putative ABC transport system permease protein
MGNARFRKMLVVCQFVFSVGLITSTLIINRQLDYIHRKELGYDKSHVFSFSMRDISPHYEAVRTRLLGQPGIEGVTAAGRSIVNVPGSTLDIDWDGKDPNGSYFIHTLGIDKNFLSFFKIQVVAGTGFTGSEMDSAHFILNEMAVKEAGIKNPVGKRLRYHGTEGTIIGVVKDFHFASLTQKIQPFLFNYTPTNRQLFVKTTGAGATAAIAAAEKVWKEYNAGFPFDYAFMDDSYNKLYRSEQRTATLFNAFAAIAILISCLGLFGLATYTAQVKIKEIGIRKVLGAGVFQLSALLSKDFLQLVVAAIAIATPLAWWAMHKWLEAFAYRVDINWWVFALSGLLAIAIALCTVSFQAIRAAMANPVKNLRAE